MMKSRKIEHIDPQQQNFSVPEGYFDAVEDAVFSKLKEKKLPKKSGYTIPANYFDHVEEDVIKKLNTEKLDKSTGFKTPDHYFETLEEKILKQVPQKEVKVVDFKRFLLQKIIPAASAAAIALFIILNYTGEKLDFNSIAATDIENWIEEDQVHIDPYQIAEVYSDIELSDGYDAYYDDETVIEYLDGTDIESILIENN